MKILYHMPAPSHIYAQRTIFNGFRNAFLDLGHEFEALTADDNWEKKMAEFKPDIFITASHFFYRKFLDYGRLKTFREKGLVMITKVDYWNSPIKKSRISEARGLKEDDEVVRLIKDGLLGDAFYHVVEPGDGRMQGFREGTGFDYHTIPLAADKTVIRGEVDPRFAADVSYVGTYLPAKREYFKQYLFPLGKRYKLQLYGQDWTLKERGLGWVQRVGQYFNLPVVRSIQKPKLALEDESKIYRSSLISVNIHEDYQREFGGDCNERTFKIPLAGGFEITDDVRAIRQYFKAGKEIVIARNVEDWFSKIDYYLNRPQEKEAIIEAGRQRVLAEHTYYNRVEKMIEIYNQIKKERAHEQVSGTKK